MPFDQLWAPWRLGYIKSPKDDAAPAAILDELLHGGEPDCFLCRGAVTSDARRDLVVHRTDYSVSVLNRYPYNNGHLLVSPRAHKAQLEELTDPEHLDLMREVTRLTACLKRAMNAEGFNVGLNLGRVAGAGVPGHLHWHIVPRWSGDTNFMPVLEGANVIPQSLESAWELLRDAAG